MRARKSGDEVVLRAASEPPGCQAEQRRAEEGPSEWGGDQEKFTHL